MGFEPDKQIPQEKHIEAPSWPPHELEPTREAESSAESSSAVIDHEAVNAPVSATIEAPVQASLVKPELQIEIEDILAEDLENLFWGLPETDRASFKEKGEETAGKIRGLLSQATVRIQDIFLLIVEWLKTLPGVSAIFVEQEAKNKADRILKLRG